MASVADHNFDGCVFGVFSGVAYWTDAACVWEDSRV
jgi:hypothetical protein